MPSKQSKRIFLGGLDKDMDPRLLKNGDYHHALNIRNIASEANTQGVIENIKGNKLSSYDFPQAPPETASSSRKITLFMPWWAYWNNYSPDGPDFDWQPIGSINDVSNEIYSWPGNFDGVVTSTFDGQPDSVDGTEFVEPQNYTVFTPIIATSATVGYASLITFNISLGFSLADMSDPLTIDFQISYNGETVTTMKNYLDFFVQQYYDTFQSLGITISVIDNNSPDFDLDYFFGEAVLNNITSHPNYVPGFIFAHALHFEASPDVGEFFIDLRPVSEGVPITYQDAEDTITGSLFDSTLHEFVPTNFLFQSAEDAFVLSDTVGYDPLQGLTDSTNWGVSTQIENEYLFLTEHMNNMQSLGWTLRISTGTLWAEYISEHGLMFANALITPSQEEIVGESDVSIDYTTIGSYEDKKQNKIYWMVAAKPDDDKADAWFHLILEYDLKTDIVSTVFRDCGNFTNNAFNWQKEFLINDINKIGDILYFTSRQYGEPCSINVRKSKNSIALIDASGPYVLDEEGGTDDISLEDYYPYSLYNSAYPKELKRHYVEVLKRGSIHAPTYIFLDDTTVSKNNLFGHMFQFRYRYHYYDNEVSPWSPISDVVPSNHDLSNSTGVVPDPFVQNRIEVSVRNSSGIVKYIELCGRRCKDLGVMSRGTRGEFFTIAKINNNFAAWQINNESTQIIDFRNDQLYPIIDAGEGDRLFDAVPRSAHTQTILGNNRLAYANYTVGYDVPLINVQLNPQYGFSQSDPSQEYGGANYDSATYGDGTGLSPNPDGFGVSSFKSGAYHNFGLVYYDERGRCSTVLVSNERDNSSQVYVKFPTERIASDIPTGTPNFDLFGAVTIQWSINHRAPEWAKHYRWFYSRNTTVDEFVQFRILNVFTNNLIDAGGNPVNDNRIFLSLRGLKGNSDSFISSDPLNENDVPNDNAEIFDYDFVKGDRIRFITTGDTNIVNPINQNISGNYIDVRIAGFEYYSQADPTTPIQDAIGLTQLAQDGTQDGWYIIIEEVLDNTGTPVAGYNTANFNNIIQSIAEIYRPKQEPGPEETIFFELSRLYDIDGNGMHQGGIADQGMPFTEDAFGNITSETPATGEFLTGDVYYKNRDMRVLNNDNVATANVNEGKQDFYVEDYFCNDYLNTNHASLGRANLYSPFFKEFAKISSITYSDVYQPATSYNGFSTFDNNLANFRDYSEIDGSIQKIYFRDTNLLVIFEDKTYNIPVQKDIILSASGEGNMGISNKVLGTPQAYAGHYGISKNPESFVVDGNVCYWVDIRQGAVLRLKQNGISPISDLKMMDYFRDKSETYKALDPQNRWEESYGTIENFMLEGDHKHFRIKGGFNPKHTEYIVQFDHIDNIPDGWEVISDYFESGDAWNDANFDWNFFFTTSDLIEKQPYKIEGSTTAWAEPQNRWVTHYSHIADYYGKINILFVSWSKGALFLHDMDEENHNTFYGITYFTELDFYINEGPSTVKGFKTLTLEANQAFESDENGVEEEVLSSYDVGLITDMTETSISRHNFDQRENKQYAHIPFVTTGSTGSEIIGLGNVTFTLPDFVVGSSGLINANLVGTDVTQFTEANIMFVPENVGDLNVPAINGIFAPESIAFSDTVFFNDTFPTSSTFGQDVPIGNAAGISFNDQGQPFLAIYLFDLGSYPGFNDTTGSPLEFLDSDGNPSSEDTGFGTNPDFNPNFGDFIPQSTFDEFVFIKRNGFSEGDRMKGRFMEVKLKKRSRRLLEIFSGSATVFNSELSDD